MNEDEKRALTEQLVGVRLDLARLETKVDSIKDVNKRVEEADDRAKEALQSTRSAHKRLDTMEDNQKWLWRTVIGAMIVGVVNLIWKGVGS